MTARWGTVVLTGATSGIGEATARRLAARCDRLIVLGPQHVDDVVDVLAGIRAAGGADVDYLSADFTRLSDVVDAARAIAASTSGIDLLINNAAVPGAAERIVTADGFERTLQVNALAPALLTRLLVPSLSVPARIINVGSSAHRVERFHLDDPDLTRGYSPLAAYARAKLAMVTWSALLAKEERGTATTVVALCPGVVDTPLRAALAEPGGVAPECGADRVLFAATADVASGNYLENDRVVRPSTEATGTVNRLRMAGLYWRRLRPFAAVGRGAPTS